MPTPSMPISIITANGKSHRTKREIAVREAAESALSTGQAFRARNEVKKNPAAYKEFKRLNKLYAGIDKNDALIEGAINRYCLLTAEVLEFIALREEFQKGVRQLQDDYENDMKQHPCLDDRVIPTMDYFKLLDKMQSDISNLDKQIMAKQRMLLDLEKENIMTIASQLRAIPKKAEDMEDEDPMAQLFEKRGIG